MCGQPWRPLTLHQVSGLSSRRHPSQSLESNFLFAVPAWTTGPPRFSGETLLRAYGVHASLPLLGHSTIPGRSALRMRQHPRVYRFPERSRLTPSNCLTSWLSRQVPLRLPRRPIRSHGPLLPFTVPGVTLGLSLFPQSRLWDVLWSARYPCQHRLDSSLIRRFLRA